MRLLAFDTSTEALSVAVRHGDDIHSFHEVAPRRHGELLLPTVQGLLGEAGLELGQLDAIAFGRGPGAFTGVRTAIAAAQGLAFSAELKVIPVSTLATLAQTAMDRDGVEAVFAAIDARMGEVYAGWFRAEGGLAVPVTDEWLGPADAVPEIAGGPWHGAGTGTSNPLLPDATAMLMLAARAFAAGEAIPPEEAIPVYLRDRVTTW